MTKQCADRILMIRPTRFGFNEEAFITNSFQNRSQEDASLIQEKAQLEFDGFVTALRAVGVEVIVFEDEPDSHTPDSIFPNNWFSTHREGKLILYPMAVPNRRAERREYIIEDLIHNYSYEKHDWSASENDLDPKFLEGTGSLIFDHDRRLVYAAISPRTNREKVEELADFLGYTPITFTAFGKTGELIYHTNVMMAVGSEFVAIGLNTIDLKDRSRVLDAIQSSGKQLIELSNDQVYNAFAGNILQVMNVRKECVLVLSNLAFKSLTDDQLEQFRKYNTQFVKAEIPTIESIGGGSARCMLAEVFF